MVYRLHFLGVLLALLPAGPLCADLTTGGTLSLEWLVDSSDAIYRVRLIEPVVPGDPYLVQRDGALKTPADFAVAKRGRQAVDRLQVPRRAFDARRSALNAREGDERLVFVRTWDSKAPTIIRQVNLTRPLELSSTAAITAEGVALPDRESIIRAVEDRVRLDRRLSDRTRQLRERVDKGGGFRPFGDPAPLEGNIGGFRLRIECDVWDNPPHGEHGYRIHDEDLLLTDIIVPADPELHGQLLEAVADGFPHTADWLLAIGALVNYPGEETERVLEEVASRSPGWSYAKYVLWYFQYRHDLSDPLNDKLVGRWRLVGRRELIDLILDEKNTFTATGFDRPQQNDEEPRHLWDGKGYWAVRDGRLSLFRHEFLHKKLGWTTSYSRTIFEHKPIKEVSGHAVILEGGPVMLKRTDTD